MHRTEKNRLLYLHQCNVQNLSYTNRDDELKLYLLLSFWSSHEPETIEEKESQSPITWQIFLEELKNWLVRNNSVRKLAEDLTSFETMLISRNKLAEIFHCPWEFIFCLKERVKSKQRFSNSAVESIDSLSIIGTYINIYL